MNDSFFRKEIQRKLAEGNAIPSADKWREIEKAVIKENLRRKKRNGKLLLTLLPLLALSCALFFWNNSTQTVVSQVVDSPTDFPSGNEVSSQSETLELTSTTSVQAVDIANASATLTPPKDGAEIDGIVLENEKKTTSNISSAFRQMGDSNPTSEPIVSTNFGSEKVEIEESNLTAQSTSETTPSATSTKTCPTISAKAAFLEINQNLPDFIPSGNAVATVTEPTASIPKISLGIGYEQNALEYCFDHIAQNQRFQLELNYRFLPRFSAGLGFGYQTINYEFQVDSAVHIAAFGNTDKYPGFYESKHSVTTIKSELLHFILPISLKYHQPIFSKMEAFVGARQDFLFNENQDLNYALSRNLSPHSYTGKNSSFQLGLTTFSAGLEYQIHPKLKAGAVFNRLISFETLGIENQYYHGFGGGANVSFQF